MITVLATPWSVSSADEFRLSQKQIESFLNNLPGFWQGEAIETPVGEMDYDMLFHSCDDGAVAAVAKTGASLHHWKFSVQDENLRISFLSTFAGNRLPVRLKPAAPEGATLNFYAPQRKILTLGITNSESQIDIHVFHNAKPHVHIRLVRANHPPEGLTPHHSLINSCRGSPAE